MQRPLYRIITLLVLSAFLSNAEAKVKTHTNVITAQSWIVADDYGNIINGKNTSEVRSIASISKLMTVIITLDSKVNLDEIVNITLYNKNFTRRELIKMALIKSDNNAAQLLCESYVNGFDGCIQKMNEKAKELYMVNTSFIDPTGLHSENQSTAEDLVKLVKAASEYPEIVEASNTDTLYLSEPVVKNKHIIKTMHNTNPLVGNGYKFYVSKTGFINKSGGCIVMMLETIKGIRTVILLGSKNTRTRIPEAQRLALNY